MKELIDASYSLNDDGSRNTINIQNNTNNNRL